ncbi:hypothetical protein Tco_0641002 [Tanacetum coccineum]
MQTQTSSALHNAIMEAGGKGRLPILAPVSTVGLLLPSTMMMLLVYYLQHEHYALWEVIEFGDSYKVPPEEPGKVVSGEGSAKKKGRTVAITTKDNKYDNAKELWEAILKTFGINEATKKTKKNQLKQQYGNFKAEGSETLEQTFNRL